MATIRLYTTALEHQTTQDITWRGTRYHLPAGSEQVSTTAREIVRVDRIDKAAGEPTIARVVERDGETATYWVDDYAMTRKSRGSDDAAPWDVQWDNTTEYTLTALPDDAARIVEAVLAKPAPATRDINYHINVSSVEGAFESERIARMRYVRDGIRDSAETVQAKARADRIAAAEKAVRVADMHREAAYQRLRNMPWSTLRWNDPRGIADARSKEARRDLDQAHKDRVGAVLARVKGRR